MELILLKEHENHMKQLLKNIDIIKLADNAVDITCVRINRRK